MLQLFYLEKVANALHTSLGCKMNFLKSITPFGGNVKHKDTVDTSADTAPDDSASSSSGLRSSLNTSVEVISNCLDSRNVFTNLMEKIEEVTTVSKKSQFQGMLMFVVLYLAIGQGAAILCNAIGWLFPLYASVKAIESQAIENVIKWLTYWLVFGSVNFMEVFLVWFPAYNLLKFALLVWCMYPSPFNGSCFLYYTFLRPIVLRNQKTVDGALALLADNVRNATSQTVKETAITEMDRAVLQNGEEVIMPKAVSASADKDIKQD